MKEKKRGRAGFIFTVCLLLLIIAAAAAAALFALVPSADKPLGPADTGIGFESLVGGEPAWMDGGLKANLLSVAVSRGWEPEDKSVFSERLAVMHLFSNGTPADITLLRDPASGELAFEYGGRTVVHVQRYLSWLLGGSEIDPVFCKVSPPPITVMGASVEASSYDYRGTSLLGRPLRFTGTADDSGSAANLKSFTLEEAVISAEGVPAAARVEVRTDADTPETVFSGTFGELASFVPESHKSYLFLLNTADADGNAAEYRFLATFMLRPVFTVSHNSLITGGSLVVGVSDIKEGDSVSCTTSFGYSPVFSYEGDSAKALIPVSHALTAGEYTVLLSCGGYEETFTLNVTEDSYERQDLEISGEGAAANTAEANIEYAETMYPLFESVDTNIYWDGLFLQPAEGSITTPYGAFRYTNGGDTPTRHAAVDIANAEGTPIIAPNNGKVLYSGLLTLSGNTLLIEHGMGLHTLYMHLAERSVETGDTVQKGQLIGTMGTTGYSTGPHLHYQMMIKDQSVSPWFAQDGRAGFFSASEPPAEAAEE